MTRDDRTADGRLENLEPYVSSSGPGAARNAALYPNVVIFVALPCAEFFYSSHVR